MGWGKNGKGGGKRSRREEKGGKSLWEEKEGWRKEGNEIKGRERREENIVESFPIIC